MVAIGPVVSEEKSFEIVDGRRTDGRRTHDGACLYYAPPEERRAKPTAYTMNWARDPETNEPCSARETEVAKVSRQYFHGKIPGKFGYILYGSVGVLYMLVLLYNIRVNVKKFL